MKKEGWVLAMTTRHAVIVAFVIDSRQDRFQSTVSHLLCLFSVAFPDKTGSNPQCLIYFVSTFSVAFPDKTGSNPQCLIYYVSSIQKKKLVLQFTFPLAFISN